MASESRLEIRTIEPHAAPATFADDVREGLGRAEKALPPKYFYDALGSKLFEAITLLEEYYPTRAEREILERYAGEIVSRLPSPIELVELGSGSAEKTRVLIAAILAWIGVRQVKQVKAPERAIEQGRQIPQALKGHV